MIKPGLVSITFRKLPPETIIALAMENTLAAIEWGGDIHVPHGNIAVARSVAKMTRDSGLKTAAYGSYYHLIESKSQGLEFRTVLDTAVELEAPLIRIWPGGIASSQADDNYRKLAIEETQAIAQLAAKQNITIAFELHRETLTDTGRSALQLLDAVNCPNVKSLWQPITESSHQNNLRNIELIAPYLTNVHIFYWAPITYDRRMLSEGIDHWREYLKKSPHWATIVMGFWNLFKMMIHRFLDRM